MMLYAPLFCTLLRQVLKAYQNDYIFAAAASRGTHTRAVCAQNPRSQETCAHTGAISSQECFGKIEGQNPIPAMAAPMSWKMGKTLVPRDATKQQCVWRKQEHGSASVSLRTSVWPQNTKTPKKAFLSLQVRA